MGSTDSDQMADDVEKWLVSWFSGRNPGQVIDPGEEYYRQGLVDSFGIIELIGAIESNYSIRFDDVEFKCDAFKTIGGLASLVRKKLNAV